MKGKDRMPRAGADAATKYSWRVRLTRGANHAVYWRTFPAKMTVSEATDWASSHHAVLKRVLGSGEKTLHMHIPRGVRGKIVVAA